MSALIVRPLADADEIDLFNQFPYSLNAEVAGDLAAGRRRLSWLWVALRDGRVVARAGWWSRPGADRPMAMDFLDFTSEEDALELLEAAFPVIGSRPHYLRFVPLAGPDTGPVRSVLERTGARLLVERLRLEWRPGTPFAAFTPRLRFRPVASTDELLDLMTGVLEGTLDAYSRDDLTRMSPREAAEEQFREELAGYESPRAWWRIATLPSGEPVGFVLPAHNGYHPIIAYLGVLPAHRGRGHIDEILAAGTRLLADTGVPNIRAATDVTNTPMAAAFGRAGYTVFERRFDMVWPVHT